MDYAGLEWRWTVVLGVALRDGILEAVADAERPADTVASELGLDTRAVGVVLAALAELGVVDQGEIGFRVRPEHRAPLLEREDPSYAGGRVVHRAELVGKWSRLSEVLRTGEPVEDRTEPDFAGTETFIRAMRAGAMPGAAEIAQAVLSRLEGGARLLDVGGGPGANAEAFARGGARVTVFDRPEVISLMRETLSSSGIETVAGDMNEGLPDGPFDAIYFGNTSHMYGPEQNRELFGRMRCSLAPGGLLVIREFVRDMSLEAALFAVNMLVLTPRGSTYSAAEYRAWLSEAGFEGADLVPVLGRESHLVCARNPL